MQRFRYTPGEVLELSAQVLNAGGGVTGDAANTFVCVQRKSDGWYYKWATSTFTTPYAAADHEVAMTERTTGGARGESGYYYKAFTIPSGIETYRVNYINTTLSLDEVEIIEVLGTMAETRISYHQITYDGKVFVRLEDDTGTGKTGKVVGDLTVQYCKSTAAAGGFSTYAPAAGDWVEISAANLPGEYILNIGYAEWLTREPYLLQISCASCRIRRYIIYVGFYNYENLTGKLADIKNTQGVV